MLFQAAQFKRDMNTPEGVEGFKRPLRRVENLSHKERLRELIMKPKEDNPINVCKYLKGGCLATGKEAMGTN